MPHQWKRRQALSELDTNMPAKIAKTSEQKFNPALPTTNRNGPRAPRAENEIHADPSYSGHEGSDVDDDDIGGIDVDDIFSINEDAAAQSFERSLLRELRALGEPCTTMAQICTSDRHAADQPRLHTLRNITKRIFPKLDVPPLEWLHKSQNFLFEWSASKGVASARIEEARGLQAPEMIWRRRTPLLERLLHSLLEGKLFTLSRKDILNHVAIGRQNSLDGIYTRLGVGEADSGGFLEGETVTSLKGEIFFPSFIYIGESKDMVFRCTTHDMDRHSKPNLQYQYASMVKSVVMLPLVLLEPSDADGRDTELRRVMEGILIAALGAYDVSAEYNTFHARAGLRRFPGSMKNANSTAGTLQKRASVSPALSKKVNPTLQPLLQAVFRQFCAMMASRSQSPTAPSTEQDAIKASRQSSSDKFALAKSAYLTEKGRLLREGSFVCVAVFEEDGREKGWAPTFFLSNLYSAAVSLLEMEKLRTDGFASRPDPNCSHYLITLQLKDTSPSKSDYYANAKPGNYDITKGLQLLAVNGTLSRPLIAYQGGPRHLLVAREKPRSRSEFLMTFLLGQCETSEKRLQVLEDRPCTWRKRHTDALLKRTRGFGQDTFLQTLSALHIAFLDGLITFRLPSNGQHDRRRKLMYSSQGHVWQLMTLNDAEFVRQNPQCDGNYLTYVRVNLSKRNDGQFMLSERSRDGVSSLQLPFRLEVWTRESGWQVLTLHFPRGATLMDELASLARSLELTVLPAHIEPPSLTSNVGAPQWINITRRIVSGSRAKSGPSSFYFILQFRRSREGQAIQARPEYRVAIQRGVLQALGRTAGDSIRVHLDFWDHEDPASYRALIANESDACEEWHAIGLPARLRDDLSRIRSLFRN